LLYGKRPFGHGMTQKKILQDNIVLNARKVVFPENSTNTVSEECKVK